MYADRLGSYSIAATRAGTPSLVRLKSILRYRRLAPPPRWRDVLRPRALRPPLLVRPSTSVFSGSVRVISAKSGYVMKRRPADVGLGLRIGIGLEVGLEALEDRDGVALAHLHDGLLPLAGPARGEAPALRLRGHRGGADLEDLDVGEQLFDGLLDLGLVRVRVDPERVLACRREHVGLLGDDGPDEHLAGVHRYASSPAVTRSALRARAVRLSMAVWLATTVAARTMSATPASSWARTVTPARVRNERPASSSSASRMTRTEPPRRSAISSDARFVDGASKPAASRPKNEDRSAWTDSAARSAARRALRLTLTM